MATTDISRSLVRLRLPGFFDLFVCRPCGLMDKALPSGGRDCGFESRLGLFCIHERLHGAMATRRQFFCRSTEENKRNSKAGN
jgi:hypothetical protein